MSDNVKSQEEIQKVKDQAVETKAADKISMADIGHAEKAASIFMPKSKTATKNAGDKTDSGKNESISSSVEKVASADVQKLSETAGNIAGKVSDVAGNHSKMNESGLSDNVQKNGGNGTVEKPSSSGDQTQATIEAMAKSAGDTLKQAMIGGGIGQHLNQASDSQTTSNMMQKAPEGGGDNKQSQTSSQFDLSKIDVSKVVDKLPSTQQNGGKDTPPPSTPAPSVESTPEERKKK